MGNPKERLSSGSFLKPVPATQTVFHYKDLPLGFVWRHFVGLVRDHDDGPPFLVEPIKDLHDLFAGLGIEVTGRLVGQNDLRIVDQSLADGHAGCC